MRPAVLGPAGCLPSYSTAQKINALPETWLAAMLVDHESKTAGRWESVLQLEGVYVRTREDYHHDVEHLISSFDVFENSRDGRHSPAFIRQDAGTRWCNMTGQDGSPFLLLAS